MSTIETRHEIIEMLFKIKNGATLEYFKNLLLEVGDSANEDSDDLPKEVLAIIERSEEDYAEGRYASLEEFREKRKRWLAEWANK